MTNDAQRKTVLEVLEREAFAVFAFADGQGISGGSPYTSVMFFAQLPDLRLIFGTSESSSKTRYLRDGAGACAQVDTRAVGIDDMEGFARITLQGRVRELVELAERDELLALYLAKLPNARVFVERPGVQMFVLEPQHVVFARGFRERFELDFPLAPAKR